MVFQNSALAKAEKGVKKPMQCIFRGADSAMVINVNIYQFQSVDFGALRHIQIHFAYQFA